MELTDLKEARSNGTLGAFLEKFCRENATKMQFPDVDYFVRQELVSIVDSEFSKPDWDQNLAAPLISTFRTIARDEHNVDVLFSSENVKNYVLTSAKLPEVPKHSVSGPVQLEAIKCLVNAQFKSQEMRNSFSEKSHEGLRDQLKVLAGKTTFSPEEALGYNYLLKILFISTAIQVEKRPLWTQESYFTVLNSVLEQSMALAMIGNKELMKDLTSRVSEVFKVIYNLYSKEEPDFERTATILKLCRKILFSSFAEDDDVSQNTLSIMVALPVTESIICPKVLPGQKCLAVFEDRDMSIMRILLEKLEERVSKNKEELLLIYLQPLLRYCIASQQVRRYVRLIVLPPLKGKDVERHPDEGDTLRNKLIRIMKSVGDAGALASSLMYVLCKQSVNRMIKYTGFGHSAGFMANQGLLGHVNDPKSDENSEDSETEEYAKVEDRVNPVTGCIRPENLPNPFEGMSEEQKMYEVEKLMQNMSKMLESGVIKPATIGDDGKTRPLKHVLEMTKNIPDQVDDSDSE